MEEHICKLEHIISTEQGSLKITLESKIIKHTRKQRIIKKRATIHNTQQFMFPRKLDNISVWETQIIKLKCIKDVRNK